MRRVLFCISGNHRRLKLIWQYPLRQAASQAPEKGQARILEERMLR
jgi:hypothetical protein